MLKTRILVLSRSFTGNFPGLQARLFEEFVLISKKISVLIISEDTTTKSQNNLKIVKVRKFELFMLKRFFQVLSYIFATIKNRNKFDIVFSRLITPENLATNFIVKKLLKKKLVVYLPGPNKTGKSLQLWLYRIFLKSTLKNADMIIASSDNLFKHYQKIYGKHMTPSKISVIVPPVDAQRFNSVTVEKPKNVLLCISRINPVKSIETIIEAMPYVIKSVSDVQLKIVGPIQDNEYYNILKNLISKLKCEDCVDFVGPIPHKKIKDYYDIAKIFIMTGKEEGQSNATLEAMACGLPVIVTPSGLMPELIQDEVNGFLIDYDKPELLGKKITSLLLDEQYCQRVGDKARNTIEKKYGNWDVYVNNLIIVFDRLMKN